MAINHLLNGMVLQVEDMTFGVRGLQKNVVIIHFCWTQVSFVEAEWWNLSLYPELTHWNQV